jgi:hypothetical protein
VAALHANDFLKAMKPDTHLVEFFLTPEPSWCRVFLCPAAIVAVDPAATLVVDPSTTVAVLSIEEIYKPYPCRHRWL